MGVFFIDCNIFFYPLQRFNYAVMHIAQDIYKKFINYNSVTQNELCTPLLYKITMKTCDLTKNSHIREQNVLQFGIYQTADQCLKLRYKSFFAYFHYKTLAKHIVFCYNNNVQTSALMG